MCTCGLEFSEKRKSKKYHSNIPEVKSKKIHISSTKALKRRSFEKKWKCLKHDA